MVPLATTSERQRQSNPRKIYPVDPGLAAAFDRSGKTNLGGHLETLVAVELERRGWETGYLNTESGYEVDFFSRDLSGHSWLIQVCADLSQQRVREREVRALLEAQASHPRAKCLLLTQSMVDCQTGTDGIQVMPTWQWLLTGASG